MALKRSLGAVSLTFYGVGMILGAGIYTILGAAAGEAGDAVWMSFALASVVAGLTGLTYAELGTMYPQAGADYVYLRETWPKAWWLFGGVGVLLALSASSTAATVAMAFGGYARLLYELPAWVYAVALLVAAASVNVAGVRESSWANIVFTIIEACGLVLLIVVGWRDPDFGEALSAAPTPAVLAGASLIFFAFLGFEKIANLAEESRDPGRDLPRAILVSLLVSAVLYVLVALASVALLPASKLAGSDAPLADALAVGAPGLRRVLGIIALFATANTALVALLAASRVLFGMAREGDVPRRLATLLPSRDTPALAILVATVAALSLLPLGRVEVIGSVASLTALMVFLSLHVALIRLRATHPRKERPFRVPLAFRRVPIPPIAAALLSAAMIVRFPFEAYAILGGIAVVGLGVVAWSRRTSGATSRRPLRRGAATAE